MRRKDIYREIKKSWDCRWLFFHAAQGSQAFHNGAHLHICMIDLSLTLPKYAPLGTTRTQNVGGSEENVLG